MVEWSPSFKYTLYVPKHTPSSVKEFYRDVSIRIIRNIGLLFKEKYGYMPARPDHDELVAAMIMAVYKTMEEYKSRKKVLIDIVKVIYGGQEAVGFRVNEEFIMIFKLIPTGFFRRKGMFIISIYDKRLLSNEVRVETMIDSREIIELSEKMLRELHRLTLEGSKKIMEEKLKNSCGSPIL
ncbi:MAG: hypothetical protein GXO43_02100 [Crenarchaeota archaeon]|nr:hypothetical protein [Thermoproteota archaeon]